MLATVGMPIPYSRSNIKRHERSPIRDDLIAGQDFLSILLGRRTKSSAYRNQYAIKRLPTTTTEANEIRLTTELFDNQLATDVTYSRPARSYDPLRTFASTFNDNTSTREFNGIDFTRLPSDNNSANSLNETNEGVIISVRVSSSVGQRINKKSNEPKHVEVYTTAAPDVSAPILTQERNSIIAEASKSDFYVDEKEPIVSENNEHSSIESIPSAQPLTYQHYDHQDSLVYHRNREPLKARSVSYSTVIQALPNQSKPWIVQARNKTIPEVTSTESITRIDSVAESKDYYVTSKYQPDDYNDSSDKRWKYNPSSTQQYESTKLNWNDQESNYGTKINDDDDSAIENKDNIKDYRPYAIESQKIAPYRFRSRNRPIGNNKYHFPALRPSNYDNNSNRKPSFIQKPLAYSEDNNKPEKSSGTSENSSEYHFSGNYEPDSHLKSAFLDKDVSYNHKDNKKLNRYDPNQNQPEKLNLPIVYGQPEQNYEVDEAISVETNGRTHGVQSQRAGNDAKKQQEKDDNQKVGYVVEGRNYRKYRVEERTSDGFIVGEYGVVSHDDGSLRGVRYTADGTINPRLIYDALMKFLSL